MLTSDLLRVKRRKGKISPRYLDVEEEEARERARAMVEIFDSHLGKPRGIIDEKVERAIGHGTDFLIWRGLAKLLYDRSEFGVESPKDPQVVREVVFRHAAEAGNPDDGEQRRAVLSAAGRELEMDVEACERALYADLEERQVLEEFRSLEPLELLNRYNVALAQAVLYRANSMTVRLGAQDSNRLRLLFQMLKFHRLMHTTEREGDGFVITLDGPGSLFKKGRKYGLEMAKFLPSLLHLSGWSMEAEVEWSGRDFQFELSEEDGLIPHGRARGQWVAEEEKWFEERFDDKTPEGWQLERRGEIVKLSDNEVLITDYVVRTADGAEVWLEIVGFWRISYLRRRLKMLRDMELETPVVLVVSERLKADRKALDDAPAEVVFFKGVILHDRVVEAVEAALN